MIGPFLLRVSAFPKYETLVPLFLAPGLREEAPKFWAWTQAVVAQESVTATWDEDLVVRRTLERIGCMQKKSQQI